jgi:hypothetical protein
MRKIITIYIILLTISLLFPALPVMAQKSPQTDTKEEEKIPLYNGTSIGVDVFGIGNKLFGGDFLSSEVSIDVNLKNRFFPVIEIGYGTTDATEDTYNIHYKSSAPYARIGLNYNTMAKKKSDSFLYAGIRYGFSAFKYDVQAPPLYDPIWKGEVPFGYDGVKSSAHWIELLVGIKVKIIKNFQMGWTLRYKARLSAKESLNTTPWYIPGYGSNKSGNFGATYNLIYKLPF